MKRVLIEFYSGRTPENLISVLNERYDEVLFFAFRGKCAPKEQEKKSIADVIRELLGVETRFFTLDGVDIPTVLKRFPRPRRDTVYDVDVTGGPEAFIAAAGIWQTSAEEGSVFLHQYDVPSGKLLYRYPETVSTESPIPSRLSVSQLLSLNGTPPISAPSYHFGYGPVKYEVLRLWNAVKRNLRDWNLFCSLPSRTKSLTEKRIDQKPSHAKAFRTVYASLEAAGIAKNRRTVSEGDKVYVQFDLSVDPTALFLYEKAGNILEMYAALAAFESGIFGDICVGVTVDWNGIRTGNHSPDPHNEIDLVMMHGNLPVLASCKNTEPENEYLYEIMTMSRHYGGYFSTPMLISSVSAGPSVRQRAREMGILLIDGVARLSLDALTSRIRRLLH